MGKKNLLPLTIIIIILVLYLISYPAFANSEEVVVFVLDSEVNFNFVNRRFISLGEEVTHGSIVTRIIAREAPGVTIYPIAVNKNGESIDENRYYSGLRNIVQYIEDNPQKRVIINISLGFSMDSQEHYHLIKQIHEAGGIIVAAAGNNNSSQKVFPAGFEYVLAVANASREGKAPTSNYGEYIDIAIPGSIEHISSVYLPWGTEIKTIRAEGTSFSAPRVVGVLATIIKNKPSITSREAIKIIKDNADPIADIKYEEDRLGAGILNKTNSLQHIDPFYKVKIYLRYFLGISIIIGSLIILWSKMGIASIFFLILFSLVLLPLIITVIYNLLIYSEQIDFTQLKIYFYFIPSIFLSLIFTSWKTKFLLYTYGILILIISIYHFHINQLNLQWWLVYIVVISLMIIIGEKWQLYYLQSKDNIDFSISKLNSNSKKISQKAVNKITKTDQPVAKKLLKKLFNSNNEQFNIRIIKLLLVKDTSQINIIINILLNYPRYFKAIKKRNTHNHNYSKIIKALIGILKANDLNKKRKAAYLLKKGEANIVIEQLKPGIETENIDLKIALEILESFGHKAKELIPLVKNIINNTEEMWICYQALRTLTAIHPEPNKLLPFLQEFKNDKRQLVSIEAKGLIADIRKNQF